eukprot:Platyproteum_vivax@DN12681_c0_g1_i1.p1
MDQRPRLLYFNARGRAELIRLIFAAAGVDYEDIRFRSNEHAMEDFQKLKAEKDLPFQQVPLLEIDGFELAQSQAIVRYLAAKYGLSGTTPKDSALCDMITCGTDDLKQKFTNVVFVKNERERDQQLQVFKNELLPTWASYFERLLRKNGGEWFVGNDLSYADLAVYDMVSALSLRLPGAFAKNELLQNHTAQIEKLPKISKWLNQRPENVV